MLIGAVDVNGDMASRAFNGHFPLKTSRNLWIYTPSRWFFWCNRAPPHPRGSEHVAARSVGRPRHAGVTENRPGGCAKRPPIVESDAAEDDAGGYRKDCVAHTPR